MRTLIIPDIHTKYHRAESIIEHEKPDKTVFLGDYFDDFGETFEITNGTAKWLASSLQKEDRMHLVGNHDLSYMTDNPRLKCSGYEYTKHDIIKQQNIQWNKMKLFCWVDDWLCTHAGFSCTLYEELTGTLSVSEIIKQSDTDLENIDDENFKFKFINAGIKRGGSEKTGGIVWCDYSEFVDIPGIKQIFGHTRDQRVRKEKNNKTNSEHICLDTVLRNYAVYQDGKMIVKSFENI